ncbi:hypothetical protein BJX66DRAFT_311813 [Aspergillus keveii]|uniref:Uncharacterized protein n=1 Tax=Aspergillus keveii TaxID=714993 RepID=A0ABR4FUS8_9EURO
MTPEQGTFNRRIRTSTWKEAWKALYSTTHRLGRLKALSPAYDGPVAFPNTLCHTVRCGEAKAVRWCLARDDAHVFLSAKATTWLVIQDCLEKTTRYTILKPLLEYKLDPIERRTVVLKLENPPASCDQGAGCRIR